MSLILAFGRQRQVSVSLRQVWSTCSVLGRPRESYTMRPWLRIIQNKSNIYILNKNSQYSISKPWHILFSVLSICLFSELHLNGNTYFFVFCLIFLNIMFLNFHKVACIRSPFLFSILCICHTLSVQLLSNHLGCFCLLAISNSASVNTGVQISFPCPLAPSTDVCVGRN